MTNEMDLAQLRPFGAGEILDVSVNLARSRLADVTRVTLLLVAPAGGLMAALAAANGGADPAIPSWAVTLAIFVVTSITSQLAIAACIQVLAGQYLGAPQSWRSSLRFVGHRRAPVVGLWLLRTMATFVGAILFVVPGVIAAALLWLALPALLLEGTTVRQSLKRSWTLVPRRWVTIAAALALSYGAGLVLGAGLPPTVDFLLPGGGSGAVVTFLRAWITESGSALLVVPLTAALLTVTYIDLRVRTEGYDLHLLLNAMESGDRHG